MLRWKLLIWNGNNKNAVKERKMKEIKAARLKAGLTQQKMSELLEIPKRTIEEWEGGRRKCPEYTKKLVLKELKRFDSDNE